MNNKKKYGLALSIELLVVIIVITIIIVMTVGGVAFLINNSKLLKLTKEVSDIREAVTSYQINLNGRLPGAFFTSSDITNGNAQMKTTFDATPTLAGDTITQDVGNSLSWVDLKIYSGLSSYDILTTSTTAVKATNFSDAIAKQLAPKSSFNSSYGWMMVSDSSTGGLFTIDSVKKQWKNSIPRIVLLRYSTATTSPLVTTAADVASLSQDEASKISQKLAANGSAVVTSSFVIDNGTSSSDCVDTTAVVDGEGNPTGEATIGGFKGGDTSARVCVMHFRVTDVK